MSCYSDNPSDIGITVVGGCTGLGETTHLEIEQKLEAIKDSLRGKRLFNVDEFVNDQKSNLIKGLREKNPPFK